MPDVKSKVKSQKSKVNEGFSLIEILVTIGLIAVVVGVAIPNFRGFSRTHEIDTAAQRLVDVLRNAQSSASSNIRCPSGEYSNNWQVVLSSSGYEVNVNCGEELETEQYLAGSYSSGQDSATVFGLANDRCLPPTQQLTIVFTNRSISYLCGTVPASAWPVTLTLNHASGDLTKEVVVEEGGVIRTQ